MSPLPNITKNLSYSDSDRSFSQSPFHSQSVPTCLCLLSITSAFFNSVCILFLISVSSFYFHYLRASCISLFCFLALCILFLISLFTRLPSISTFHFCFLSSSTFSFYFHFSCPSFGASPHVGVSFQVGIQDIKVQISWRAQRLFKIDQPINWNGQ